MDLHRRILEFGVKPRNKLGVDLEIYPLLRGLGLLGLLP
jgi:hypothetical protein